MKKTIAYAAMVLALGLPGAVQAHGDKAKHGGIVATASDLAFELVHKDGKATLYVEDHGKPVPVAGASGKLTVLNGAEKSETALQPASGNMLVSAGDVKLAKGAKAIASITFADKKVVNVRFALK